MYRQNTILRCILVMLLCAVALRGQSTIRISGTVYDASSATPVVAAQVVVLNTPYEAWTDADGRYFIEGIPHGRYQVECHRLGYISPHTDFLAVYADQTIIHNFYLDALPVAIDSIDVVSGPEFLASVQGEGVVLYRADIERYRTLGLNAMLQQVAGVQVDAAGGSGSRAIIRIHGSRASQVLVLLDGQRLNDSQTGEVDLTVIPMEDIERVEVIRQGNTALYGGGAFDGVVHFHSREASASIPSELTGHTGSFSSAGVALNTSLTRGDAGLRLSYRQDYSRQNFPYTYEGRSEIRRNSWSRNRGGMLRGSYNAKQNQFTLLVHGGNSRQGLPSFFYSEFNPYVASLQLDRTALQLRHTFMPGGIIWQNSFSVNDANSEYVNLEDPGFTRYHLQQDNRVYEGKSEIGLSFANTHTIRLGATYMEEQLRSVNLLASNNGTDYRVRHQYAAYAAGEWKLPVPGAVIRSAKLNTAIRLESYFRQPLKGYPLVSLSMVPRLVPQLGLTIGWSKAVRYPDFNSLFWKGDARASGNPNLLPERKESFNASARLRFENRFAPSLQLYYYDEEIDDLIFWDISVGVWRPQNLLRALKRGLDVEIKQPMFPDRLQMNVAYSLIDTENRSPDATRNGKELIFIPRHTLNLSLWSRIAGVHIQADWRYVSERQVVQANTAEPLTRYRLLDISGSYQLRLGCIDLQPSFAVKNLGGEDYELIRGYPMPGREYRLSVLLKLLNN